MISGWAGSGKDTLHKLLSCAIPDDHFVNTNFMYRFIMCLHSLIFSQKKIIVVSKNNVQFYLTTPHRVRVAFADSIKKEVHVAHNIPVYLPKTATIRKGLTLRQLYINHGQIRKNVNPNYWTDIVVRNIKHIQKNNVSLIIDVTDFRFLNEYYQLTRHFANVVTSRVYRASVPEPDKNIESEHELDSFECDMFIVFSWWDYIWGLWRFPQYRNYSHVIEYTL